MFPPSFWWLNVGLKFKMTFTKPPVVVVAIVAIGKVLPVLISANGVWTAWSAWSTCSKTCGGGDQYRTRNCDSTAGCTGGGGNRQTQSCNTRACTALWGEWSNWSVCSTCLKEGQRWRGRYCYYGSILTTNDNCVGSKVEYQKCFVDPCGTLGPWATWSNCRGCGTDGWRARRRTCDRGCDGPVVEYGYCNATRCKAEWMDWNPWGLCSKTDECGWGTQQRTRDCPNPDTHECTGNATENQNCITTLCGTVESNECEGLSDIVFVVDSSASIGLHNWFYTRAFVATVAKHLDIGENKTRLSVVTYGDDAHLDFNLTSYFNKTLMMQAITSIPYDEGRTNTQGGLAVARTEALTEDYGERPDAPNIVVVITDGESNIQPENTIPEANRLKQESDATVIVIGITDEVNEAEVRGIASDPDKVVYSANFSTLASIVSDVSELTCQEVEPPPGDPATWAAWSSWGQCSVSCGGGVHERSRSCNAGSSGVRNCSGNATDTGMCNTSPCPVPATWTAWSSWGQCSVTCGSGVRERSRFCNSGSSGVRNCPGSATDTGTCNTSPCPVPATWTAWSSWGHCSVTCGSGVRERSRSCNSGSSGVRNCQGNATDSGTCNTSPCPGGWTEWGSWSECSKPCNLGRMIRGRDCMNGYTCDEGPAFEYKQCNIHPCPVGPCGHRVDLALVVDSSASVGEEQWEILMDHIYDQVDILDVSRNGARVAMIQYSTSASVIFDLSTYTDKEDVLSTLRSVSYSPGATNTQEALRLMRTVIFGELSSGDKKKVPNVCLLYTGGGHNIEPENTYDEALKAKADGIYVIAVGATPDHNRTVLEDLAFDETLVHSPENITLIEGQIGEIANLKCKSGCSDKKKKDKKNGKGGEDEDCDSSSSSESSEDTEEKKDKKKDKGGKDSSESDEDKKKKGKKKDKGGKDSSESEEDKKKNDKKKDKGGKGSSESDKDKKKKDKKKDKEGKDGSKSDEGKKKKDKKKDKDSSEIDEDKKKKKGKSKKRLGKETESSESEEAKWKGKGNKKAKRRKEKVKKGGKGSCENCDPKEEKAKGKDRQKKGGKGGRDTGRKAESSKRKGAEGGPKERGNQKEKGKTGKGNDKGIGRDREGGNNKKKGKDTDRRG